MIVLYKMMRAEKSLFNAPPPPFFGAYVCMYHVMSCNFKCAFWFNLQALDKEVEKVKENLAREAGSRTRSPPLSASASASQSLSPRSQPLVRATTTAPAEGTVVGGGGAGGSCEGGELALSGFDLRAAMESGDLAEVKGHMRFLHDLVSSILVWYDIIL